MEESPNHLSYFVPGLQRGLKILEFMGAAEEPMSLSEIGRKMDLSRSSTFRLVYTLRQLGFLKEAEQKNSYTLGSRVLNLGFAYLNQQTITNIARPHLSALRDRTGISAHLSVLEGSDVLYLGSHQARTGYVSNMVTGTRVSAYSTAIGWCLLIALSDEELAEFCKGLDMHAVTEHTPTNFKTLKKRVNQVKKDRYIFSRGLSEQGGSSVAVPVRGNKGEVVACVNISGPDSGFEFDKISDFYVPETRQTALQISRELGYGGEI